MQEDRSGGGPARTARPPRSYALDGLRGVAALVVVLHHALLTVPALAEPYRDPARAWQHASWFTLGPLHLLWDGPAAVTVFFVLSGMVLAPAFLQRRGRWAVYYPSRLARLYLPVVGAVLLAVALALLVPRRAAPELSWWTAAHAQPVTPGSVVHTMLLTRISQLDTPLWSLKWEVRFSLLLPLYVLAARWLGRRAWLLGLAALPLVALGTWQANGWLQYLPVFALGVAIAGMAPQVARCFGGWGRGRTAVWLLGCLLLVGAAWWPLPGTVLASRGWRTATAVLVAIGASGLVALLLGNRRLEPWGHRPVVHWLGSRSFSLYLTHEPLVVCLALLLPGHHVLVVGCGVMASLLLAELFYRGVERPSHAASRRVARAVQQRVRPAR